MDHKLKKSFMKGNKEVFSFSIAGLKKENAAEPADAIWTYICHVNLPAKPGYDALPGLVNSSALRGLFTCKWHTNHSTTSKALKKGQDKSRQALQPAHLSSSTMFTILSNDGLLWKPFYLLLWTFLKNGLFLCDEAQWQFSLSHSLSTEDERAIRNCTKLTESSYW